MLVYKLAYNQRNAG